MAHPSQPTNPATTGPDCPRALAAAVERALLRLAPEDQARVAAMPESRLEELNGAQFGASIRKDCGLWRGNQALMEACGALNPEEASLAIMRALRARLRGDP